MDLLGTSLTGGTRLALGLGNHLCHQASSKRHILLHSLPNRLDLQLLRFQLLELLLLLLQLLLFQLLLLLLLLLPLLLVVPHHAHSKSNVCD